MALRLDRRQIIKAGLGSTALLQVPGWVGQLAAQSSQFVDKPKEMYEGPNLPGGGQLDVRMSVEFVGNGADPDVIELQRRMLPYNPDSWHVEWYHIGEKNEQLAHKYEGEGRKATAFEHFARASRFYTRSLTYLPETDDRMLPTTRKMVETFEKMWTIRKPPFERFSLPWEGKVLDGYFYPVPGARGRAPVVYLFQGADSVNAFNAAIDGGFRDYWERGLAVCAIDEPGRGTTKRLKQIYMPPDWERFAKAVVDYLVSRPEVDPNRIAVYGASMGGYTGPRAVALEKRIAACAMWSGHYALREDLFDYFPPIQDRMRWIIGAKDIAETRKRLAEYTLAGKASQIECPMLIGYSHDDRITNPLGAQRLYQEATRSKRELKDGIGHMGSATERRFYVVDWLSKTLQTTT